MSHRKLSPHPLHAFLRGALTRTAGALGAAAPLAVLANPTGGQVVGGSATIGSAGANGVVIDQTSQHAIIDWQQFSVGSGQYVQFVQPDSSAVVLNRVTGGNPSSIFGDIIANGQVFLVNPNGVYFAPGASIDVQGLVASTLDLKDSDFMQGRYRFSRAPGASDAGVVNDGVIRTGRGGYVVLAGDYAQNGGAIMAQTGRVYLAAGNAATLTLANNGLISYVVDGKTLSRLAGVSNTGEIVANGGLVVMTADVANTLTATAVNNSGLIAAHSVSQSGGEIVLLAQGGDIENSGTLDASANTAGVAGGTVIVRGNGQTQLDPTSVIDASGDAAEGGFVELSGHHLEVKGSVDPGRGGGLLIDPASLNIVAGTGSPNSVGSIGVGYIQTRLSNGVNVVLVASNAIGHAGSVTALDATSGPGTGKGNLTIKTGTLTVGAGGSLSNIGFACYVSGVCQPGSAVLFTPTNGAINLSGMNITIKGAFVADAQAGLVTLSNVVAPGGITLTGSRITAGSLIASNASVNGPVLITGKRTPSGTTSISQTGVLKGKSVTVTENLTSSSGNYGGNITLGSVHATTGSISIAAAAAGAQPAKTTITTGKLTASRDIKVSQHGLNGSVHLGSVSAGGASGGSTAVRITTVDTSAGGGSGNISTGRIIAVGGGVQIQTSLGNNSGGNIHALAITGPYISLDAAAKKGADISVGTLHATGTGSAGKDILLKAIANGGVSSSGGRITVNGSIAADHGSVNLGAQGGLDSGGHINVHGAINATGNVTMLAVGSGSCCDGTVSAGDITASNIFVSVSAKGSGGASLTVGNLKAGSISLDAVNHASGSAAITAGNIIASHLWVDASANRASGQAAHISLGSISAINATREAVVVINATGKANTVATGPVSVSGHALGSVGEVGPTPVGALLQVTTHGGASDSINIGGPVSVTALADSHGTLGDATVEIGAFTGTSSAAPVASATVSVGGNLTVSAARDAQLFMNGAISGTAAVTAGRNIGQVAPGMAMSASALALRAGNAINVSHATFSIGTGAAPGVTGDTGITTLPVNAGFMAGRTVNLGNLKGGAGYVLIKAASLGTVGTVTLGSGTLVQLTSTHEGDTLGIGNGTGTSVFSAADIAAFSGYNVVLGDTAHTGAMDVGTVNLGTAGITLANKGAINGSGLLTAGALILRAGTGAVSLTADVASTDIMSGADVKVDDTAFTGAGALSIGAGVGSVSYAFGAGTATLGTSTVKLTGALTLTAKGTLDLSSDSIQAGGKVNLTAGQHILLGNTKVKAGGTFSADAHGSISDGGSGGAITAAGETFKAGTGKVVLDGETLDVGASKLAFSAAGSVALNSAHIHAGSMTVAAVGSLNMTGASVQAAGMQVVTGGSIDLSGDTLVVTGAVKLTAGLVAASQPLAAKDIVLSGVNIKVGTLSADAGGTIHNGGATGTITAGGLALTAGKDITLSSTQITVGNTSMASLGSDPMLLAALATVGLGPASPKPSAYFDAGGTLTLGKLTLTGSYLYLQGGNIAVLGPVSAPTDSVVQLVPVAGPDSIGVEQQPGTGSVLNLSNAQLLSLFPGTTLVLGNGSETGAVTLGSNGSIDIGSSNLIVDTSGSVTGLENVISTGLISTVESLLASALAPPTTSEIDPNSSNNNNTAGKHHQQGDYDPAVGGTGGGTISQSSDAGGACH